MYKNISTNDIAKVQKIQTIVVWYSWAKRSTIKTLITYVWGFISHKWELDVQGEFHVTYLSPSNSSPFPPPTKPVLLTLSLGISVSQCHFLVSDTIHIIKIFIANLVSRDSYLITHNETKQTISSHSINSTLY